jgi:hypothetical protein
MDLPFSLACCNKSIIAFPLRTPGWILSGRFGKLAKAHSSSQGIPTSSAILFNGLTALSRPVEAGAKACAEAKVRARIENLIFVVYLSVCSWAAHKNRQSRWIHASAPTLFVLSRHNRRRRVSTHQVERCHTVDRRDAESRPITTSVVIAVVTH